MRGLVRGLTRFMLGAAVGAALGAAAGTLYAPASGEELKRRITQRLNDVRAAGERAERQKVEELRREYEQHVAQSESEAKAP